MYRISTRLIDQYWEDDYEVSNALGVLLLTWNSAFYRFGYFKYDEIEGSIRKHRVTLNLLRERELTTMESKDQELLRPVFYDFLASLRSIGKKRAKNEGKLTYSPVSVGKALHLLCPSFFPLWDDEISKGYGCTWKKSNESFDSYLRFMRISYCQMLDLQKSGAPPEAIANVKPLKLLDEFNYLMFTKELEEMGKLYGQK